jgi:hypothetical protein
LTTRRWWRSAWLPRPLATTPSARGQADTKLKNGNGPSGYNVIINIFSGDFQNFWQRIGDFKDKTTVCSIFDFMQKQYFESKSPTFLQY